MKKTFTLIEWMIVIMIILLLGAIAIPNLYRAKLRGYLTSIGKNTTKIEQIMGGSLEERDKYWKQMIKKKFENKEKVRHNNPSDFESDAKGW